MMSNITIRTATNKDSKLILDLIFDIWINEYHFDVHRKDFPDLLEIEKFYVNSGGMFLIAIIEGEIVGTIACNDLGKNNFLLKRMFVKKTHRRMGIAQMLLDHLFEKIVDTRKDKKIFMYLSTKESEAVSAKAFYLKNGFRVVTKIDLPNNFHYFYKDDLFMLKDS